MLRVGDFEKKQMLFLFTTQGDKLSFRNDNIVIKDGEGKVKHQSTCYRLFILFVVGDITITSGLIKNSKKFGFSICMMSNTFKLYEIIGNYMEGNTLLHKAQYSWEGIDIGKAIVINKIYNQRSALNRLRNKSIAVKEAINTLDSYINDLKLKELDFYQVLGLEGSASRIYFPHMFNNVAWCGRKPRVKSDYVNVCLDIGYTLLFNFIDAILKVFGFDVYYGVLHKSFYMRKSLVCDIMEPFRPIVDLSLRKAINLKQCQETDFKIYNNAYVLDFKKSTVYVNFFMKSILEQKEEIFVYIQTYYRCFMKQKEISSYPFYEME